jgi:hypothetical protein
MKLLKQIRWALGRPKLERDLRRFCELEYRPADRSWALSRAMYEHKNTYLGNA